MTKLPCTIYLIVCTLHVSYGSIWETAKELSLLIPESVRDWAAKTNEALLPVSLLLGVLSAVLLGSTVTIFFHIMLSPLHKPTIRVPKDLQVFFEIDSKIEYNSGRKKSKVVVISRKIDASLNELLNSLIESKIAPWYSPLVSDSAPCYDTLKELAWISISSFHERLAKVDSAHFVMCGVVSCLTHHLERICLAEAAGAAKGERGIFHLCSQLSSPTRERNFLRLVAEFLIKKTLPQEYHKCSVVKTLLKELIACQVLEPWIDKVCNPDWINNRLLTYLRQQQAAEELEGRTYHYAASYEDFINLIHDSSDINDLQHLRHNIINEIMQATAINNLKKAKGIDTSKDSTPQGTGKGDLLQARNLKRYINQLTYAKAQCEKRISQLRASKSCPTTIPSHTVKDSAQDCGTPLPTDVSTIANLPGSKILMFQVLLESAFARRYFALYLDGIGQGSLLSFWTAVRELRQSDKRLHYQLGMEIYHTYLAPQPPPIKVDKVYLRGVEAFLLGNRGPEVLLEIAENVERTLEERHYAGFLVSQTYRAMLNQANQQNIDFMSSNKGDGTECSCKENSQTEVLEGITLQLSDHSTYARNKLAYIHERLTNKLLALQAIKQLNKADPKVIQHLESETATLRSNHRQLEAHIERTALWSDNLGFWRVYVQDVQLGQEREPPHLTLLVHLDPESLPGDTPKGEAPVNITDASGTSMKALNRLPSSGWVVIRKMSQLIELHRKLCQIAPWMKNMELPALQNKLLFNKQLDKCQKEKIRVTSQNYFNVITKDEKLCSSEVLYAFLSPSPEHLKQPGVPPKKARFSFSTLFKSDAKQYSEDEELGSLILMDPPSEASTEGSDASAKDSVAEPLFAFLEELCELRGVGKWLRKTLVSFVQITYGKNITRHVRETLQSLMSESMIVFYLNSIQSTLAPQEETSSALKQDKPKERTQEEILQTRQETLDLFLRNLPELFCTLVGQQNAKRGATRLFSTLQHHALNKHLFYMMFEVFLMEVFPELKERLQVG